ncbi:hypothetical protein FHL15_000465 [Xylaria flabelliformis]|uniref:Uncharacterized protein n=1 Tax=Xylaria flabelliformis TaxID=2512241 RepID=A0A553IDX3_9PEZI|nr:hypothetical protein FHL15_000465 [Xylaria flabelliformis]
MSWCAFYLPEKIQNLITIHPHILEMMWEQWFLVLERHDNGANKWLPLQRREPRDGINVHIRDHLVVEGLVGRLSAYVVKHQRHLNESRDGGTDYEKMG